MPRKLSFWLIALLVLVLALGAWIGVLLYRLHGGQGADSPYSVVYLQTGDIYYGKLHEWPRLYIEDPWYLLRNPQTGETSIVPFSSTFSGPSKNLYLNPREVVWWATLRSDSQVVKGLEGASQISVPAGQATQ